MKTLVIGMDGAQAATFTRGWTPFLQSLIEKGQALSLQEDLISRGWAEIVTGEHATKSGAMYERPLLGGTHRWTDKFSLADMPQLGTRIRPIWQALNERGHRVGIMNVPTTFPVPVVDGFFVSGGGGGGGLSQTVKPEQCHPKEIAATLNAAEYILDERLPSLLGEKHLFEPDAFFGRLAEMSDRRTSAFIQLAAAYSVDFGLLVYRSTVTTEMLLLPELARAQEGAPVNQCFIDAAQRFYATFDEHIRRLVETYPGTNVVLVSDHSMAPRKWSVNFNTLLQRVGLQRRSRVRRSTFDLVKSLRFWIPRRLRVKLKASPRVKSAYESMAPFDTRTSLAFTMTITNAIHGIYVNDDSRFGGPVLPTDVDGVIERIVAAVNDADEAKAHGITARAFGYGNTLEERRFPDVVIDMPDGYAPSNEGADFVTPYTKGLSPIDLRDVRQDKRISCKAPWPLAVFVGEAGEVEASTGCRDLTAVYRAILSRFC